MALLITEVITEDCDVLVEAAESGAKSYYITGPFMAGAVKNRNGRIYPTPILESEMNRYNRDYVAQKRALGELGHPQGPAINADRVSHLITEMHKDGNNFIGRAKLLDTPMGKIVKTFVDEGVKIGVSTRGLGSVKPVNGIMEVQSDFMLAAVDVVTEPSGPGCFVNGIMEGAQYYYDIASGNWRAQEQLEETVREVKQVYHRSTRRITEADAMALFKRFVTSLG